VAHLTTIRRCGLVLSIAMLLSTTFVRDVAAQGFISPFLGYNFSGDAGCPDITNCEDKKLDWGVAFGALGPVVGFEAELGYTPNFFGESSAQTSNVLTFMANFMLAPKFGPIQPYGVIGLGLIRTSVEATGGSSSDENQMGWDGGGGLMVFFGEHVGVRGEVRYYRTFEVLDLTEFPSIEVNQTSLDYGRFSGGVVFKF